MLWIANQCDMFDTKKSSENISYWDSWHEKHLGVGHLTTLFLLRTSIVCLFANDLLWLSKSVQNYVWVVHNIPQLACQVSSYFPSLVPFQVMKCVNILERNINSRHPEHSLLSMGAICWAANESFRAKTTPRRLNTWAAWASYVGEMNIQSAITTSKFYHEDKWSVRLTKWAIMHFSAERGTLLMLLAPCFDAFRDNSSCVQGPECVRITEDMSDMMRYAEIKLRPTFPKLELRKHQSA